MSILFTVRIRCCNERATVVHISMDPTQDVNANIAHRRPKVGVVRILNIVSYNLPDIRISLGLVRPTLVCNGMTSVTFCGPSSMC